MYLISLYFDEHTENKIKSYMGQIAKCTGNDAMTVGNIPPHITVSAFHAYKEETALEIFDNITTQISRGSIQLVSVGSFLPSVLFVMPVLNEYLQNISTAIYKEVRLWDGVAAVTRYRPFSWVPHVTIGKELTREQMQTAFLVMQNQFAPFKAEVGKIGLARTNPYTDIENIVLK